jgi:uncharacterized protein (TIRG00374 family)
MLSDESNSSTMRDMESRSQRSVSLLGRIPWLRLTLSLVATAVAVYLVTRSLDAGQIRAAVGQANLGLIIVSLLVIGVTTAAKSLRWQLMFLPASERPPLLAAFWALTLGQFVNILIPVRVGEVVRIYSLEQQAGIAKARALGTLVIEKTLDSLGLLATMFLLLPFVVLPAFVVQQGYPLALLAFGALMGLLILATQSRRIVGWLRGLAGRLPVSVGRRFERVFVAGLEGLAALRNIRLALTLGLVTAAIVVFAVLTPYLLFHAFGLPLGVEEAIILNLVLSVGLAPPSTPGKVLVFEGLVALMLRQFGIADNALILSFAIVYHLVVVLPQVAMGSLSAAKGGLRLPSSPGGKSFKSSRQR